MITNLDFKSFAEKSFASSLKYHIVTSEDIKYKIITHKIKYQEVTVNKESNYEHQKMTPPSLNNFQNNQLNNEQKTPCRAISQLQNIT